MGKEKWPKRTVDVLLSNEKYTGMRFLILRKEMWSIFLRIITRLLYQPKHSRRCSLRRLSVAM